MTERILYPRRQCCLRCRRTFAFEVILGLYCSRSCAGLPERPADVRLWPRRCRVFTDGRWIPKAAYFSAKEAAGRGAHSYLCELPDGCGMYHLSKRAEPRSELATSVAGKEK